MSSSVPAGATSYLVESYWPGVTVPGVAQAMQRLAQAAEDLASRGSEVSLLMAMFVEVDEAAFCVIHASSAATVEETCRRAELPVDRIVPVIVHQRD